MKDFDALMKVYQMASHANDLGGEPRTEEETEALGAVRRYLEAHFRTELGQDTPQVAARTMCLGGAGNGA